MITGFHSEGSFNIGTEMSEFDRESVCANRGLIPSVVGDRGR